MFLQAARFNHSYVLNAFWSYDIPDQGLKISAIVDLSEGTETFFWLTTKNRGVQNGDKSSMAPLDLIDCACGVCDINIYIDREREHHHAELYWIQDDISGLDDDLKRYYAISSTHLYQKEDLLNTDLCRALRLR